LAVFRSGCFQLRVKNKTAPKNQSQLEKIMMLTTAMKFNLGNLVITPAALEVIPADDILTALDRHITGDWGDVTPADRDENNFSLREGFRLLSVYHSAKGEKFWIITEADRRATTILLPSDY
jgi:hypothetical protein